MKRTFILLRSKLALLWLLSSAVLLSAGAGAQAHEVKPTIADLTVADGRAVLALEVNLEALLAGIDLDTVEDTDNAENAGDYDALRSLPAAHIADRAPELLPKWNSLPLLSVDGAAVPLESVTLEVPEGVDSELPRDSQWRLEGAVPAGAEEVQVTWPDGAGALVLRQQGVEAPYTGYLSGGETSPEIALGGGDAESGWQAFVSYIPVGFDHILPKGLDHILFVLGLFFLSTRLRPLIWQVTAFTLAHTVTLALGALGWVNVPGAIVEPLIAASITYVAVENIFHSALNRWRPLVIFGFGLLHGLGFASVLGDFGLPAGQFVPALIGFNIGVELGQLAVIAIAFVLVGWAMNRDWYRRAIAVPVSCVIAAVGAYWFIERVFL
ncbi:HupE/UreJ family protein [Sulfitobacter sp. 1A13679]|uniref:HupE/UreJ family protein n=1 Tax=Sulfitobacter sp. 1A13679 TaxID=3368597 RepID=UPI0037451305